MRRPSVTVVMPFAGDAEAARAAVGALVELELLDGDELIVSDNSGTVPVDARVTVVRAGGERSPAHARNAGAARARGDWILFLDADCCPPSQLLDRFFDEPVAHGVGALVGEVAPAPDRSTVAARYGATRSFLGQQAHLAHPYRPRAAAANLLVRRSAFEQVGGFYEGLRAAEDTDFAWRLQEAGWLLELRPGARVEHRYRATMRELRRQWRGYAAGRAWLARRYDGFRPEPAVARALRRLRAAATRRPDRRLRAAATRRPQPPAPGHGAPTQPARSHRRRYLAIDALLAADELVGLTLSNKPARANPNVAVDVVLIAERFPSRGDPLVELALTVGRARVEATARPAAFAPGAGALTISYREDDGWAARMLALGSILVRNPLRCVLDLVRRSPGDPPLRALAPAARRVRRDSGARVRALGTGEPQRTALRLAALASRPLQEK